MSEVQTHYNNTFENVPQVIVLASALATLSGCGTDDEDSQTQASPPTQIQAARFLQQASFSSKQTEVQEVQASGYPQWIQAQLTMPPSKSNWDWLVEHGYVNDTNFKNNDKGASNVIWQRLMTAKDTLRQRMALALSEFFVVGIDGINISYRQFAMAAWWDLLCENAFGDFRILLERVTLNAAMGKYLNMAGNQKENTTTGQQPDENYAREILQLFTIGLYELNLDGSYRLDSKSNPIETFTQETITNLARVFTGWDIDYKITLLHDRTKAPMVLNTTKHSTLEAKLFGITIPSNTDGYSALTIALDTIAKHPNVAPFFSKQIIQRLITSNPSPQYIQRIATVFNNNGKGKYGDLGAVLTAVLLDNEARNDSNLTSTTFGKLREPILRFIQWGRTFDITSTDDAWNIGSLDKPESQLGQQPLDAPSVFNFFRPNYTPPNSTIASNKLVAPEFQIVNETSAAGYLNFMQTTISNGLGYSNNVATVIPNYDTILPLSSDSAKLIDNLNLVLCANIMSQNTKTLLIDTLTSMKNTSIADQKNRIYAAIFLTMSSYDYLIQK